MKTVVSPVYLKFDGNHLEFLHFLGQKVDDMIGKVDCNRYGVLMSLIPGYPLVQDKQLQHPK